jgi:biopolymer transport protein ExbD
MAEKRRFLDVWLVEPNTVYREVPFAVVTDWVEQSRLVPDDMIRPSGTAQWFRVGDSPDFKPYVPQADTYQIEDESEALESVNMDFTFKKRGDEEDDDVDMIPLIDVSLVLLVFFMLTATTAVALSGIITPAAVNGLVVGKQHMLWVNVALPKGPGTNPVYSVSVGEANAKPEDSDLLTISVAIDRLRILLNEREAASEVTIRADKDVESGDIRDLTVELGKLGNKIHRKFVAVGEKNKP